MNIRAKLDSRLSRLSPITVYLVGIGDGLVLAVLAFGAGFLVSKVAQ